MFGSGVVVPVSDHYIMTDSTASMLIGVLIDLSDFGKYESVSRHLVAISIVSSIRHS
jgi:hypothetical protein